MPVVDATIEAQIRSLIERTSQLESDEAKAQFYTELATIIAGAVRAGTVTVSAGIPVQVTPGTGTGATIGPGTGTIS